VRPILYVVTCRQRGLQEFEFAPSGLAPARVPPEDRRKPLRHALRGGTKVWKEEDRNKRECMSTSTVTSRIRPKSDGLNLRLARSSQLHQHLSPPFNKGGTTRNGREAKASPANHYPRPQDHRNTQDKMRGLFEHILAVLAVPSAIIPSSPHSLRGPKGKSVFTVFPDKAQSTNTLAQNESTSSMDQDKAQSISSFVQNEGLGAVVQSDFLIIRTFCPKDTDMLIATFDQWISFPPCDSSTPSVKKPVDILLYFSQTLDLYPKIKQSIERMFQVNEDGSLPWAKCIGRLMIDDARIAQADDLYLPHEQTTNELWVNGPNRQFERGLRLAQRMGYQDTYLMEADSRPIKKYWLDDLQAEIASKRPFAILGSTYKGDKWFDFEQSLPLSLLQHLNGAYATHACLQL
jgi:hypothetical protein